MNRTTLITVLVAALSTIAIAGCGTAAPSPTSAPGAAATAAAAAAPASAPHNDADIAFVQGMIPHHTQAVAMSQLVQGRASSPKVTTLATQIEQAQGPEITQMQGFLQSWNVAAAPTGDMGGMTGMPGMGGSSSGMSGMMSDQQMQQLDSATGATFDRLFLQMMTEHHTGAITMSKTELRDGQNPDAKALAQKIIDAQQAEITTMKQLLTTV